MEINPNLFPPNGYYFIDSDSVRHEAAGLDGLVKALTQYRVRNAKPIGKPRREIVDFICAKSPHICTGDPREVKEKYKEIAMGSSAVIKWITALRERQRKTPSEFVTQTEADRRAAICAACPFNREWRGGCGGCNDTYDRLTGIARKGKLATGWEKLLGCRKLGWDNRTAVWLNGLSATAPDLPEQCWRRA